MLWRSDEDDGVVKPVIEGPELVEVLPDVPVRGFVAIKGVSKRSSHRFQPNDHIPEGIFTSEEIEHLLRKRAIRRIGD